MMQCPTRDTEPNDYQQLYRKHVHENMMLHEKLKQMGTVEKSKLRMMQNESAAFKNKYHKYMDSKKKSCSSDSKIEHAKQTQHRSSYLVCKDLAYSSRTWHDIVDVTKSELDVYKTEVLTNTVGERPESGVSIQANKDIPAYAQGKLRESLPVIGSPGDKTHSRSTIRIIVSGDEESENNPGLDLPNVSGGRLNVTTGRRMSSLSLRTDTEDDFSLDPAQPHRERSMTMDSAQTPRLLSRRRSSVRRSVSFNTNTTNDDKLSPTLQNHNTPSGSVTSVHEDTTELNPRQARPFRRRSLTIDTAQLASQVAARRRSSLRTPAGINWQTLRRKTKVLTASLSLLHDARDIEIEKTRRSFEDLSHCRYLRVSDDKSFNDGLDNRTYSREKLNSDEDLHHTESPRGQHNELISR